MDREVQWCPRRSSAWIPSPPLPQLTAAEAQSRGRPRTSRGAEMQNRYVRWWGGALPGWVAAALARGGGARISLVQWLRQTGGEKSGCCPRRCRCWTWGAGRHAVPLLQATPSRTLCALRDPLHQLDPIDLTKECGIGRGRESCVRHLDAPSGVTSGISVVLDQTISIFSRLRPSF